MGLEHIFIKVAFLRDYLKTSTIVLWFGKFNILLVVVNNILYNGDGMITYCLWMQKTTFFSFLIWICIIELRVLEKQEILSNQNPMVFC